MTNKEVFAKLIHSLRGKYIISEHSKSIIDLSLVADDLDAIKLKVPVWTIPSDFNERLCKDTYNELTCADVLNYSFAWRDYSRLGHSWSTVHEALQCNKWSYDPIRLII